MPPRRLETWRVKSPCKLSTLMTSAPWSASSMVADGPETTLVRSMMRMPCNGPGMDDPRRYPNEQYGSVTAGFRVSFASSLGDPEEACRRIEAPAQRIMWPSPGRTPPFCQSKSAPGAPHHEGRPDLVVVGAFLHASVGKLTL